MAKRIKITQKQLEEAMDVFVNKMGAENAEQALKRTQKETEQQIGSNKDVNYVVSSDQIKESKQNVFSKAQLLEARRKYLKEHSEQFTKANFIKK
jgi:predicted house-cleaning NTP pyrophosphatase (Maf/HAM1 superfamily)